MTGAQPPLRVLVVEDNPDGRDSLRMLLRMWGCEVEVAADGAEGVRKALAWRPEVALVDIGLPKLDGYGVAREIRAALGRGVHLVALTAYSENEPSFQAGFDEHLTKPADPGAIWTAVGRGPTTPRRPGVPAGS